MNEQNLNDLIDQYLLGKISSADKAYLEQLIKSDPGIAEIFHTSQQAFKAIQAERNRLLREKLRAIDQEGPEKSAFLPRWIKTILILLAVVPSLYYMLSCFYHPTSLACRYFEPHVALENRSKLPPDPNPKWTEAENAFQQKQFELAITLYASLRQETDPSMSYEAQWNILLAQLALTGPTPNWKLALHSFMEAAPEHLRTQAEKLFRMLDSPVYKFLFAHIHGNISVIKPRFI